MSSKGDKLVDVAKNEGLNVNYDKDSNMVTVSKGDNSITFENGKGQNYGMVGEFGGYNHVGDKNVLISSLNSGKYDLSYKPKNNLSTISNSLIGQQKNALDIINNSLRHETTELLNKKRQVPQQYKQIRNNLSVNNEQQKRRFNEHIANTGNHQAGGYAISGRLNNLNSFNKEINNANISEQSELGNFDRKIAEIKLSASNKIAEIKKEFADKKISYLLKENERLDNFNIDKEKFNINSRIESDKMDEDKRMNDAKIKDMEEKLKLDQNEDLRKQQEHGIEMEYKPKKYQAELDYSQAKTEGERANTEYTYVKMDSEKANTEYTYVKMDSEKANKEYIQSKINQANAQTAKIKASASSSGSSKSSGKSSGGSSTKSSNSNADMTKLSTKDLAASIKSQASTIKEYKANGDHYFLMDKNLATTILLQWRNKYDLTSQEVNDIAIILGIQSYI